MSSSSSSRFRRCLIITCPTRCLLWGGRGRACGGASASVSPAGWALFISRKVVHPLAKVADPYRVPASFPRLSKAVELLTHVFPGEMFLLTEPTARWEGTGGLKVAHL